MFIIIPGAYNAQTGVNGASQQGQIVTIGSILKVTERDRRPFPTDAGIPSEIWIDNTAGIGYICKESDTGNGTVWDRLELLGDFVTFGDGNPGAIQDITMGYRPGSLRYARNSEILWICKSNTQGAAVWDVLSSGGSVVSVNGQTGVVQLYLDDILDVNTPSPTNGDVLTWDSGTSTWIAAAPTGGGGTYTVDNGLTASPTTNNFQLGGTLLQDTTIDTGIFILNLLGNLIGDAIYNLENTAAGGFGAVFKADDNAVVALSNIGEAIFAQSTSNIESIHGFTKFNGTGDTTVLKVDRIASSSGGIGVGASASIDTGISNSVSVPPARTSLKTRWESGVGNYSLEAWVTDTNVLYMAFKISPVGQLRLPKYGIGTFVAVPTYSLGVDASGNVVEFTGGGTLPTVFQYEIHVSQVDGNDTTGNGNLLNPVATITKALTLVTGLRRTIIIHPGNYSESPNITAQYTVLTTYELLGGNTLLTGTISTSTGCTISGIKMTNLTITAPTGTGNVNILNCEVSGTLTKNNTADYTLIRFCDIATTNITGANLVAIFGGNPNFITVNNASARVIVKTAVTVAPVLTAGSLSIVDSIVVAAVTNAFISAAGTFATLLNSQFLVIALNNVAPIVLNGFYSIINCVFDKPTSTLVALSGTGGSLNSIVYSQYINADKFIKQGGTTSQFLKANGDVDSNTYLTSAVTSVSATVPNPASPALSVLVSTATTTPAIAITANGTTSQYFRGDGSLATFPSVPSQFITYRKLAVSSTLDATDLTNVNTNAPYIIEMDVATANNLTIPLNATVAFSIGSQITVSQYGAGQTTIVATVGVTLRSPGSFLKLAARYSMCTLMKVGTDEWYVVGQLAP